MPPKKLNMVYLGQGKPSKGPHKPQKVRIGGIGQQNKPKPPKPKGKGPWVWSNLNNRWTHPWCKQTRLFFYKDATKNRYEQVKKNLDGWCKKIY